MKEMVITTGQTMVDWPADVVELEESKTRHTSNYHPTSKSVLMMMMVMNLRDSHDEQLSLFPFSQNYSSKFVYITFGYFLKLINNFLVNHR